ncbi:MAG TPA: TPM domain-containing protein, partial [Thermoanaerobaculia bacterium]|nr:TPM domain-containing protein [Thermoanaerobaculia bacterium]
LNAKLREFEQRTGVQFIVYTIASLEGDSLEDFSIRAAEQWRVGQKKFDNGLILFVFPRDRKMRIEVGYGLEATVTDAFSSRVLRQTLTPHFQRGDYAGGLSTASDQLIAKIETGEDVVGEPPARGGRQPSAPPGCVDVIFIVLFIAFILLVIAPLSRRGGCGGCFLPLFFMPGGTTFGGHRGGFGGGGFGGFSGGGGGFGGGGASGSW